MAIVAVMTVAFMGTIISNFNDDDDGNNGNKNEDGHYGNNDREKNNGNSS